MMRHAFTLIEIVFVLVILGIVAAIGTDIVFKAYENYLISQQIASAHYKTDLALEQISKRLEYRIPYTAVSIHSTHDPDTISPLSDINQSHEILAWIARAYEARRGEYNDTLGLNYPGWSGFADLNESNKTQLRTKGCDLSIARNIIHGLTGFDLNNPNDGIAITFQTYPRNVDIVTAYGWRKPTGTDPTDIFAVHATDAHTFVFDDIKPDRIYEHYSLTSGAYAVVPEQNPSGDYNLTLYYDFRPWMGERFSDGKSTVLVSGMTKFNFRRVERSIELRLCTESSISSDINVTICGKKVVF